MVLTTILGLLIATLVVLYFLDFMDKSKKGSSIIKNEPKTPESLKRAINKTLKENQTKQPENRLRICPICGTILSNKDYLIAAFEPVKDPSQKRRVNIYGCPYCFTTDGVIKESNKIDPSMLV